MILLRCLASVRRADPIHRPSNGSLFRGLVSRPEPAIPFPNALQARPLCWQGNSSRGQHAGQHHSELAGERDLGLAHAGGGHRAHPQLFRVETFHRSGQVTLAAS